MYFDAFFDNLYEVVRFVFAFVSNYRFDRILCGHERMKLLKLKFKINLIGRGEKRIKITFESTLQ